MTAPPSAGGPGTPGAARGGQRGGILERVERFVRCSRGCRHWGAHGAAGLLIRRVAWGEPARYLLVLRHEHSHEGGTWGVPGGALHPGEQARAGALREAEEEIGAIPCELVTTDEHVDDHGEWSYTTLVVDVPVLFEPVAASWETAGWRWVTADEAPAMALHPALRAAWPRLTGDGPLSPAGPTARG